MWIQFRDEEVDGLGDLYRVQIFNPEGRALRRSDRALPGRDGPQATK